MESQNLGIFRHQLYERRHDPASLITFRKGFLKVAGLSYISLVQIKKFFSYYCHQNKNYISHEFHFLS